MGELISLKEKKGFGKFWMLLLPGDFPCESLRELLTTATTCLDPSVGQILTTIDAPLLPFSLDFERKEWSGNEYLLARKV